MSEASRQDHRPEIMELVHRYAYNIRTRQAACCADLFTEEAVFEIRSIDPADMDSVHIRRTLVGRDAIRDYMVKTEAYGLRICPLIFNLLVDVDGDSATGNCVMESRTWPPGHEVIGEYDDGFRREAKWLFQSRVFTIFQPAAR